MTNACVVVAEPIISPYTRAKLVQKPIAEGRKSFKAPRRVIDLVNR